MSDQPTVNPQEASVPGIKPRCSQCQSLHIFTTTVKESVGTETVELHTSTCLDCGTVGDFAGHNPAIIEAAKRCLEAKEILAILNQVAGTRSHVAYIARTLEIPNATMEGWLRADGHHSPADLALLRMLRTYPWLLQVADSCYSLDQSQIILVEQAATALKSAQAVVNAAKEAAQKEVTQEMVNAAAEHLK